MIKLLAQLRVIFGQQDRAQAAVVFIMTLLGAFAEAVSISIILPFIELIVTPEKRGDYFLSRLAAEYFNAYDDNRFLLISCVGLIVLFTVKNAYLTILTYAQNHFIYNKQLGLARTLLNSYLTKPYEFYFAHNSAQLQRNINILIPDIIQGILLPFILLLTELAVVFCVLLVLIVHNPVTAFGVIGLFIVVGGAFYLAVRKKMVNAGARKNASFAKMVQWVNQSIGGIKEVKLLGREKYFIERFYENSVEFSRAARTFSVLTQIPRFNIEFIAVCSLILLVMYQVFYLQAPGSTIPILGLFGMAAFRLMPSVNRIVSYLTSLRYYSNAVDTVWEVFCASRAAEPVMGWEGSVVFPDFSRTIEFIDVSYRYPGSDKWVLKEAFFSIERGQTIGIVGSSGAGKTTLVDLLLGLLKPDAGRILVDGKPIEQDIRGWQKLLGYIPQNVFLIDDSISNNVAFGINPGETDNGRVWAALDMAQISLYVKSLPDGTDTVVGEQGICLSGGQRQRIAIARALYNDPPVLVLDEATSALDQDTEKAVSEAIETFSRRKTMIIIAHRLSTIANCDVIYEIVQGKVLRKK